MLKEIALDIPSRRGRANFVGGYVRDRVMNSEYAEFYFASPSEYMSWARICPDY